MAILAAPSDAPRLRAYFPRCVIKEKRNDRELDAARSIAASHTAATGSHSAEPVLSGRHRDRTRRLGLRGRCCLHAGTQHGTVSLRHERQVNWQRECFPANSNTFDINGTLSLTTASLHADDLLNSGGSCYGTGGYDDIADGTQVVITDETGATVALGDLENSSYSVGECTFDIKVAKIPAGKQFYKIEVSHRGGIQYTEEKLREGPLLTLGN